MTKASRPAVFQPSAASLAALAAIGTLSALVSLFLWAELLLARAGGPTVCGLADPEACARLWEGPLATAVHRITGLPVAGWGLAWALAATGLPLLALVRTAEQRPRAGWLSAVRITAGGGMVAALMLMGAAIQARTFCLGCFFTYVLVFAYAGIALLGWRELGLPQRGQGLRLSLAAVTIAALALLYPGLQTGAGRTAARDAIARPGPATSAAAPGAPTTTSRASWPRWPRRCARASPIRCTSIARGR